MCKSLLDVGSLSFDVAKGSSIARSRSSRKHASHSLRISHIANVWLNSGGNEQPSGEKPLRYGATGQEDISFLLGQRGPLTERGIREIIAKLGQTAKLTSPLGSHDLRHTFAKALLDPVA